MKKKKLKTSNFVAFSVILINLKFCLIKLIPRKIITILMYADDNREILKSNPRSLFKASS